jgi:hypothetical protein
MGFWHTGYAEFHEPTGLGTSWSTCYTPPPPVRYACEHCSQIVRGLGTWRRFAHRHRV